MEEYDVSTKIKFPAVRIFFLLMILLSAMTTIYAKPFDSKTDGSGVFVGEVGCYGEHEIQPQFLVQFRDKLQENLQIKQKDKTIHLVGGTDWITETGDVAERELLTHIHMDAIVYAPLFQKDLANAKTIHYAENVFGEDYFWNETKLEARRAMAKKPYRISPAMTDAAKDIGLKHKADYLLFCNVVEVDAELANSIFNSKPSSEEERAKHIKVDSNYYLIDVKTGFVYEGHIFLEKTARLQELFGTYGKAMNVETLLQAVFDKQAKKIVKDVFDNGKKALEKHE